MNAHWTMLQYFESMFIIYLAGVGWISAILPLVKYAYKNNNRLILILLFVLTIPVIVLIINFWPILGGSWGLD